MSNKTYEEEIVFRPRYMDRPAPSWIAPHIIAEQARVDKLSARPTEAKFTPGQLVRRQEWNSAILAFKSLSQNGAGIAIKDGMQVCRMINDGEVMCVLEHSEIAVLPEAGYVKSFWVHVLFGDENYYIPGYQLLPL